MRSLTSQQPGEPVAMQCACSGTSQQPPSFICAPDLPSRCAPHRAGRGPRSAPPGALRPGAAGGWGGADCWNYRAASSEPGPACCCGMEVWSVIQRNIPTQRGCQGAFQGRQAGSGSVTSGEGALRAGGTCSPGLRRLRQGPSGSGRQLQGGIQITGCTLEAQGSRKRA